jgi:hypothetical protein
MMTTPRTTTAKGRELVIALHCSGAGSSQWRQLGVMLGEGYELLAPEHYGSESAGPWSGEHPFALADEAARTIALIDAAMSAAWAEHPGGRGTNRSNLDWRKRCHASSHCFTELPPTCCFSSLFFTRSVS